ncbi:MAG: protein kinase [Gemmatimonadota bacterium]
MPEELVPEEVEAQAADDVDRQFEDRVRQELAPELHLIRALGKSRVAQVYLARDPELTRLVAVKFLAPALASDETAVRRFAREAQSAARIAHPNVVTVYRVGHLNDGLPYLVMRYVKGRSLAAILQSEGPLPAPVACDILGSVASAVAAAHDKRIVHRDVKPANVLVEDTTGNPLVFDFGIAAVLASGDEEPDRITTMGHVIGDPQYMSPERLRGEQATERSDVYNLGILGYELFAGAGPFQANSNREWIEMHLKAEPRRLSEIRACGSADLESLLLRCLAKEPDHRPNADDVAQALMKFHSSAPKAATETAPPAPSDAAAKHTSAASAGASAEAAGIGVRVPSAEAPPMPPTPSGLLAPHGHAFRLDLLGSLDLSATDGGRVLSIVAQPKRVALLAYLAIGADREFKRRDSIIGVFWPDFEDEKARHALRQAVYVLRRSLGASSIVSRGDDDIGVDRAELWCDAVAFEQALAADRPDCAMELYRGQLLPGFYMSGSVEFEHWLDAERLRLERLAADAAWKLAAAREVAGDGPGALHWAQKAQEIQPFDESMVRRLIELRARLGDRAGALHTYEEFARRLKAELEAEPAAETQQLVDSLRSN